MKTTNTETLAGRLVDETIGTVRGSALSARRVMKFSSVCQRGLNHGPSGDLTESIKHVREIAEGKIKAQAAAMGADAIVNLRLELTELADGSFQATCSGTAVKTSPLPVAAPTMVAAANDDIREDEFSAIPVFAPRSELRLVSNMLH